MTEQVRYERNGDIAIVSIANPPVNVLGQAVRQGLLEAFAKVADDASVRAVVLLGEGKAFIAGADISEFKTPGLEPHLPDVIQAIEDCAVPVIAAISGACLGGGLEVALGCHRRIVVNDALLGFPEVTLGILPGAGGTQRTTRLTGIRTALDLITSGRRFDAREALELGLIDAIVAGGDARSAGLAEARRMLDEAVPTRRVSSLPVAKDNAALAVFRETLRRKQPKLFSPHKCVDAVEASQSRTFADGMATERRLFLECRQSPQRSGLVHAFFAERSVNDVPERGVTPRTVETVGVIGGGTMGAGIATALLQSGLAVTMVERDQAALDRGMATVRSYLDDGVKRGKMAAAKRDQILAQAFTGTTAMKDLATHDLVIEAVYESMDVKRAVFAELDGIAKPGAVLATNTSYLDIDAIAQATARPSDVIGLHFFSPAHVMKLLEIVVPAKSSPEAVATGFALGKTMRKIAVRAGVCDGFIGNRLLAHYRKAADYMMLDGASPYEIDAALEAFGFAMGPYAVSDLAGLDIAWASRKRLAPNRDARERYVTIADRICENGWFGRKTGRGFYLYDDKRQRSRDPEVEAIIDEERRKAGVTPRAFTPEEIVTRYMTAMANEAARVVEDKIALRPSDVDAVKLFGYGFPRHEGGPLHWADAKGLPAVLANTRRFADEDAFFWREPQIMQSLAAGNQSFSDLNKSR